MHDPYAPTYRLCDAATFGCEDPGSARVIDYVFYSGSDFRPKRLLKTATTKDLKGPTANFPSDHISIAVDMDYRNEGEQEWEWGMKGRLLFSSGLFIRGIRGRDCFHQHCLSGGKLGGIYNYRGDHYSSLNSVIVSKEQLRFVRSFVLVLYVSLHTYLYWISQ